MAVKGLRGPLRPLRLYKAAAFYDSSFVVLLLSWMDVCSLVLVFAEF